MDTINLDRAEPALEAPGLNRLIEAWLQDCEARLPSDTMTARGYRDKIIHFRRWWDIVGPDKGWVLRESDLREFEVYLRTVYSPRTGQPLSYGSRSDVLRRLRQMFKWASRHQFANDYTHWVPVAHGELPRRPAPNADHIVKLFSVVEHSAWPTRDGAILAVMAGTGIRRGECAGLNVDDITMDADGSGAAVIRYAKRTARTVRTKRRSRLVAFGPETGEYLRRLIDEMGHREGPLFRSILRPDSGLTGQGIYKIVVSIIEDAGLRGIIKDPCHDLRRAFVTHWERAHRQHGAGMRHLLQQQVGHNSDAVTETYSRMQIEDVREVMVSPVPAPVDVDAE